MAYTRTFNTTEQIWMKLDDPHFQKITRATADFIDTLTPPCADLGEPNAKRQMLEELKGVKIASVSGIDFDYDPIPGQWGTILCFEILEHLFNPLAFLENIKKALLPDGILYLSTPWRPHFLWTEAHYHEIDDARISWLFDRAGFLLEKQDKIRLFYGWKWHLRGVRPLLRINTFTRIYKLKIRS